MSSILDGADDAVDRHFAVFEEGLSQRYGTKKTYLNQSLGQNLPDPLSLIDTLWDIVINNWKLTQEPDAYSNPSVENWRLQAQTEYNPSRKGEEVKLEREIVKAFPDFWVNNVPTSSGLRSQYHDKARNIDLIYNADPEEYWFYELKWDANTPVFAAIEVLYRGILFALAKTHMEAMGYNIESKPMLAASRIRLRVLAPMIFYSKARIDLTWLEEHLNLGLERFYAQGRATNLMMDFGFERFPGLFDSTYDDTSLKEAIQMRRPAFPLP